MQDFKEWRKDEILQDGGGLNAMHSPLVCGDIFELRARSSERYVLIGQACDLMMRKKGSRRATLGFLFAVEEKKPPQKDAKGPAPEPAYRRFELGEIFGQGAAWQVDFQNRLVADLDVLDLAVFDPDGIVSFRKDLAQPDIALPEGWERRLKDTKSRFCPSSKRVINVPFSLGHQAARFRGKIKKGILTYPFKRIGRLEPTTATAVLAAWATFETRAALQHDFAAPESESTDASAVSSNAVPKAESKSKPAETSTSRKSPKKSS
jgi:hypothetical protein